MGDTQTEMPKYKCTKIVHALKIARIAMDEDNATTGGGALLIPEEDGYAPVHVDSAYLIKHVPAVGGYFVVYKDGYQSFSPALAFEEGYERI